MKKISRILFLFIIGIVTAPIISEAAVTRSNIDKLFQNSIDWSTGSVSELPIGARLGTIEPDAGTLTRMEVTEDSGGGNAGKINRMYGVPKFYIQAVGTGTTGTSTVSYIADDPDDYWSDSLGFGSVTVRTGSLAEGGYFKTGTDCLQVTFEARHRQGTESGGLGTGTAGSADGVTRTLSSENWSTTEKVGFWYRSSIALNWGDIQFQYTDGSEGAVGAGTQTIDLPTTDSNVWKWYVGTLTATEANKDDIDAMHFIVRNRQPVGTFTMWFDGFQRWRANQEMGLTFDPVQDGIYSVNAQNVDGEIAVKSWTNYTENTDFFVNYGTETKGTTDAAIIPLGSTTNMGTKTLLIHYGYKTLTDH